MNIRCALHCSLLAAGLATGMPAAAGPFTLEQVMGAPFPSALIADPGGRRFAWVERLEGRRNVWLATPRRGATGFDSRALTRYTDDDGQDVGELHFVPGHDAIVYVRGGDFEAPDKPYPNPAHSAAPPEQDLWLVGAGGGSPAKLAEGHAPAVAPHGERIVFVRKGNLYAIAPRGGAKPEELVRGLGDLGSVRFAPDGRAIAFVSVRGDHSAVGLYSFADRQVRWLDAGFGFDVEPTFSPDGARIAFLRLPYQPDEVGIGPHRSGIPWSIRVASTATGRSSELYRAPAGPGSVFHGLASEQQLYWTRGDELVFPAEADGWLHLYAIASAGGAARLLTPGTFEIEYAATAPDGSSIVYAANAGDVDRRHLWRLALPGGERTALTTGEGIETMPAVAADNLTVAYLAATARVPMHAAALEPGGVATQLRPGSLPAAFPADALVVPQPVTLTARDGIVAHADLFLPPAGSAGRHPAVVFMHGGPIRQMLLGWHYMDYYSNAYAMNQYLASRGYVVLSLNYRAGIGYGLAFREAEHYGATGASEYNDVLAAAEYLRSRADVDPSRLGLWGGSYGGYLTALGLARNSDLFAAGVDVHGVHDWYHDDLTLARNNVPYYDRDVTPAALETAWRASPMSAVATWRSPALFIHGDDDRNVSFSETTRLVTALKARGAVECEELVLTDEIHDFLRHATWLKVYAAASEFLDRRLAR
jgi:dipeptidyl aminopeptidase/acylaminoacyl peptidase